MKGTRYFCPEISWKKTNWIRSLFDLLKQVFNVHPPLVEDEGVREVLNDFSQAIVKHSKDESSAAPLTLLIKSIVSSKKNIDKVGDPDLTFFFFAVGRITFQI